MSCCLVSSTSEAETVRFNLINPATGNRIKMQTLDAGTGEEVSRGDVVKGYAVAKNEYVLLDKQDFERVNLESARILDIEKFVPRESIDRLYWDMPYHLVPSGKTGVEAFAVIREAMKKKGMAVIGRLVMSTRERICTIEIEESGLLMTTLRTAEEVPGRAPLRKPRLQGRRPEGHARSHPLAPSPPDWPTAPWRRADSRGLELGRAAPNSTGAGRLAAHFRCRNFAHSRRSC